MIIYDAGFQPVDTTSVAILRITAVITTAMGKYNTSNYTNGICNC
jgi:hypothetical protein